MSPMPFSSAVYEAVTNPSKTKAATLNDVTQVMNYQRHSALLLTNNSGFLMMILQKKSKFSDFIQA
jgi:hypothetical protein